MRFPWLNVEVKVVDDFTEPTGEEHLALANMERWSDSLRTRIERACFADYLDKVDAIAATPPTVPVIKRPEHIWRHVEVESVRAQGPELVVVYAVPEWDIEEQHEWCIHGTDDLIYVGQVLCYYPNGYYGIEDFTNSARDYDEIIEKLEHLPQEW
ncbi:hypothetical protein NG895_22750 [Aeoliella sp. ICT_H6.2]|uniref:DUF6985 domain-containing protein n=1 Tax=Aeoliella straminimaris TaxID=2954799 RepID=A0A9X2FJ54_9BACT|nr:hypothetical protein [Aeoliella straminimaris]MCO6046726.1 hypothetical protein [Aeoliella straminimaris]